MAAVSSQVEFASGAEYKIKNTFLHVEEADDDEDDDAPEMMMVKAKSNVLDGTPSGDRDTVEMSDSGSSDGGSVGLRFAAGYKVGAVEDDTLNVRLADAKFTELDETSVSDQASMELSNCSSSDIGFNWPTLLKPAKPTLKLPGSRNASKRLGDAEYKVKNTFIHYQTGFDDEDDDASPFIMVCKSKSNIVDGTPSFGRELSEDAPVHELSESTGCSARSADCVVSSGSVYVGQPALGREARPTLVTVPPILVTVPVTRDVSSLPAEVPSIGSIGHAMGNCKPCAWHWKPGGCVNERECGHCHACDAGALKRRKKARAERLRSAGLMASEA